MSEAGEVHIPHARSGVLGAQDLPPEGLHPTEAKVCAVADALEPKRVAELTSFLGQHPSTSYYRRMHPRFGARPKKQRSLE